VAGDERRAADSHDPPEMATGGWLAPLLPLALPEDPLRPDVAGNEAEVPPVPLEAAIPVGPLAPVVALVDGAAVEDGADEDGADDAPARAVLTARAA
jgi:hypothetical protein